MNGGRYCGPGPTRRSAADAVEAVMRPRPTRLPLPARGNAVGPRAGGASAGGLDASLVPPTERAPRDRGSSSGRASLRATLARSGARPAGPARSLAACWRQRRGADQRPSPPRSPVRMRMTSSTSAERILPVTSESPRRVTDRGRAGFAGTPADARTPDRLGPRGQRLRAAGRPRHLLVVESGHVQGLPSLCRLIH